MGVSKVIYGGGTLVDLTDLTVTPAALLSGFTARNAAGDKITGTAAVTATDDGAGNVTAYFPGAAVAHDGAGNVSVTG